MIPVEMTVLPLQLAKSAPVWNPLIFIFTSREVNFKGTALSPVRYLSRFLPIF